MFYNPMKHQSYFGASTWTDKRPSSHPKQPWKRILERGQEIPRTLRPRTGKGRPRPPLQPKGTILEHHKNKDKDKNRQKKNKDLCVLGDGPQAEDELVVRIVGVGQLFQVCVDELVLFITARPLAASLLWYVGQRRSRQINGDFLKLPKKAFGRLQNFLGFKTLLL